jgi:hypothetical protein
MFLWEVTAMNKAGNNGQFDTDILQCRADILRNRNIIPPHDNTASKNPETQNNFDTAGISTHKNAGPIPIETIPAKKAVSLPKPAVSMNKKEESEKSEETPKIPIFDLADEIMAEQRKITAIRRKAPGQKTEAQRLKPETRIDDHSIEQPQPLLLEQETIIAEIVAKDIERLCRGNYPGEQRL